MCGIAGFWLQKRRADSPEQMLARMADSLAHRGPDDSGIFYEESSRVGLSFRRLSIIDVSRAGHQPMQSASGRFVIVFNGEVYNSEAIRKELGPGYSWKGHSDTEVMLEAFEKWGLRDAVQRFVGMFAFALWDRAEHKLHLVRDRLGIKPLYFGQVDGDFVFGSELKAIRQFPEFERKIDRGSLALFMRYSYVPAPYSIYAGIHKLQPGCIVTLCSQQDEPVQEPFWSLTQIAREGVEARVKGSETEIVSQLEEKLADSVRLRMIADVPIGAFLSGGIDSSTVVALMQAQSSRPVKTFTIGFHEDGFNEAKHAKRVAAHLGTDHTELYLTPDDVLKVVPSLPTIYDEPFGDSSQIPTFLVSQLARQSVTVSLSGDGGDELFGGYNRYTLANSIWKRLKWAPQSVRKMAANIISSIPPGKIDQVYRWLRLTLPKLKHLGAVGDKAHKLAEILKLNEPEAIYARLLSTWKDPSEIVPDADEPDPVFRFAADSTWLSSFLERMMLTDTANYLPDDILTKVDRATMAVSLEARVPLIDHRVVEFAWRLPAGFKIRDGKGKWILRQVLYKYVPKDLVERPKMGFGVPIDAWLRGPLKDWAEDLLSEEALRREGLFAVQPIRARWKEHVSGQRNWHYAIWNVLMFQEWLAHSSLPISAAHP